MQKNFRVIFTLLLLTFAAHICKGQGTPAFSTTPPGPIDLGPSAVGVPTPHSGEASLQLNNTGTAALNISTFTFSPFEAEFTSESTMLPPVIMAPGDSKRTAIIFTPQAPGKRTIQLALEDNSASGQDVVVLTGTGFAVPDNDYAVVLDPNAPATIPVSAGGSATFAIWALAGPNLQFFNANFQCTATAGLTCSVDNNISDLAGGLFAVSRDKFTVTVTAPAQTASALRDHRLMAWMCGFGVLTIIFCRRNRAMMSAVVLMAVCLSVISCGSGSSAKSSAKGPQSLTITATPAAGSTGGGTHSLTVPLVVQ